MNPVGFVNEFCQKHKLDLPEYVLVNKIGATHSPIFTMQCSVKEEIFEGTGLSKKEAKEQAAREAIKKLNLVIEPSSGPSFRVVEIEDNSIYDPIENESEIKTQMENLWNGTCKKLKITIRKKVNGMPTFKTYTCQILSMTSVDSGSESQD